MLKLTVLSSYRCTDGPPKNFWKSPQQKNVCLHEESSGESFIWYGLSYEILFPNMSHCYFNKFDFLNLIKIVSF